MKSLRAEAEKPWGDVTANNKATTDSAPRSKTLGLTPQRFLASHDIPAKSVSNLASSPFSQVKSLRAEAAKSRDSSLPGDQVQQDNGEFSYDLVLRAGVGSWVPALPYPHIPGI